MSPRRALITGGTGFVGANLVAALNKRGIRARVLRRPTASLSALSGLDYELVTGDILAEPADLAQVMAGCEWLFHVGAVADYWRQSSEKIYRVNVQNVLAAAQQAGVKRVVFTSSQAALGLPAKGQWLNEESLFNLRPEQFPYGHSKHLAEIEVRRAVTAGLEAIIVNPCIVLGPRDLNQISGSLILEAARGRLRFTAPGGANFVAVADVAAGHIAAAEWGRPGERYILGGENLPYTIAVPLICQIVGQKKRLVAVPAGILPPLALVVRLTRLVLGNRTPLDENQIRLMAAHIYADTTKAHQELHLPQTPFPNMVQQSYDWYKQNGFTA